MGSPIDSMVVPEPSDMAGYDDKVIMHILWHFLYIYMFFLLFLYEM